jgi:hypothetical protein
MFNITKSGEVYTFETDINPVHLAIILAIISTASYKMLTHPAGAVAGLADSFNLFIWLLVNLVTLLDRMYTALTESLESMA